MRIISVAVAVAAVFFITSAASRASVADDLRKEIDQKNAEVAAIEKEIQEYRKRLAEKEQESQTLKTAVSRIDLTLKKINSNIRLAETRIARTRLEIRELDVEIKEKTGAIDNSRVSLAALMVSLSRQDEEGLLQLVAKYKSLAGFFNSFYSIISFEGELQKKLVELRTLKQDQEEAHGAAKAKSRELAGLLGVLADERNLHASERKERAELLQETQNQEKKYQALLQEQERKRAALEDEIREIEQKIGFTLDPSSIPLRGSGILGWPLSDISLKSCWNGGQGAKNCITQYFGNTDFARRGAYNGKGHNGVDLRADIGTPVFAAERGAITAVGDTDIGCRGASYGKWILIRHPNNLATLYTHLSAIHISPGQEVARGDRIGFSGKTGYATGPHLHFAAFVANAVEVTSIRSRVCGRQMTLPIAPTSAYLNPLDYL